MRQGAHHRERRAFVAHDDDADERDGAEREGNGHPCGQEHQDGADAHEADRERVHVFCSCPLPGARVASTRVMFLSGSRGARQSALPPSRPMLMVPSSL